MWMGGRVNTTAADPRLSLYIMKYIISNSAYLDYLLITQYSIIMLVDIQACSITLIYNAGTIAWMSIQFLFSYLLHIHYYDGPC
jgi:hypothetical protein